MDGADYLPLVRNWSGAQVRFMTAGSVDDGKSTLIGRLLLDAKALSRDQAGDGNDLDLAAITDGLEAERAQGITIDVAYRYFATPRASFVIADAPGHEQYTRNMVTAASVSDLVVLVIDASRVEHGVLRPQTRRHAAIAALMGLNMVVAVNKMDRVGWSQARFAEIAASVSALARALGVGDVAFVPVAAKSGDNVVYRGGATWYEGPTLVELLEDAPARASLAERPLRLPVQIVLRDGERRLLAGRIESGAIKAGDRVRVGAQALPARVRAVYRGGRMADCAEAGASVEIELAEERAVSAGDLIAGADVRYVQRVAADLCWLDTRLGEAGRRYRLRQGTLETRAMIEEIAFVRDIESLEEHPAEGLELNDIASVRIAARDPLAGDLFAELPGTGAFVLFDAQTNQTVAAGMIREALP